MNRSTNTTARTLDTPVLFLIFNRPDTTLEVFGAIRQAQPPRLYIACDGPRADREGEARLVSDLRRTVLAAVDWPCEVHTLFREVALVAAGPLRLELPVPATIILPSALLAAASAFVLFRLKVSVLPTLGLAALAGMAWTLLAG